MLSLYHNTLDLFIANWRWLLVLSVLPLFADNAIYNLPLLIMALLGSIALIRYPGSLWQRLEIRYLLLLFAALWLPQLLALTDAVEPEHSLRTVMHYPGYLFAALFIAASLGRRDLDRLYAGILVVMAVWFIDALLAWAGLETWLGYTTNGVRISGILFNKPTLGHIVALLSPLVFDYIRNHMKSPTAWLFLIGTILIVMLSGRRVAWVMLALAASGYAVYIICILRSIRPAILTYTAILFLVIPLGLYHYYQPFEERIETTLGLFSGDIETIDQATAHRLDIWISAANIGSENWFNGVGTRGFRHVYTEHAPEDHFWTNQRGGGPTHPHQFVLEIMAETGVVGIVGYMIVWPILLLILWRGDSRLAWPFALALAVALFPLNAHMAFYSSYWSALVWWLIGIVIAIAAQHKNAQETVPRTALP